jgi:hypothetical protein
VPAGSDPVYELHGIAVRSPLPLHAAPAARRPDWTVSIGPPREADGPAAGELIAEYSQGGLAYWATRPAPGRWTLRHRGAGETELDARARTIELRRDPRSPEDLTPLLLAGSVVAHAVAADGSACLHASAVEVDGRAVAFAAPSGRGKSTLAALLCAQGARVVSDDVLRCEIADGELVCFRGSNRLRLRPQAEELAAGLQAATATADGRIAAAAPMSGLRRVPLAAVVVPAPSRATERVEVVRIRGREAAGELLRSMRLIGWTDPALAQLNLDLCETLLSSVPVLRATIPWGPPFPPSLADEILDSVLTAA